MTKELKEEVKKKLEPSIQIYATSTKRAVTSLQQMLEWAREDMVTAKVELDKAKDDNDDPIMKAVLERQYAFRLGLYEHLKGLEQTAADEELWATDAKVNARLGVEPDLTPPYWMTGRVQQPINTAFSSLEQPQPRQRRGSRYPAMAMSWISEDSPAY